MFILYIYIYIINYNLLYSVIKLISKKYGREKEIIKLFNLFNLFNF